MASGSAGRELARDQAPDDPGADDRDRSAGHRRPPCRSPFDGLVIHSMKDSSWCVGADAADPVQDPLAAPGVQAQVRVGETALPAGGVLQEDVVIGRAVPDARRSCRRFCIRRYPAPAVDSIGSRNVSGRGPVAGRPDDDVEFDVSLVESCSLCASSASSARPTAVVTSITVAIRIQRDQVGVAVDETAGVDALVDLPERRF